MCNTKDSGFCELDRFWSWEPRGMPKAQDTFRQEISEGHMRTRAIGNLAFAQLLCSTTTCFNSTASRHTNNEWIIVCPKVAPGQPKTIFCGQLKKRMNFNMLAIAKFGCDFPESFAKQKNCVTYAKLSASHIFFGRRFWFLILLRKKPVSLQTIFLPISKFVLLTVQWSHAYVHVQQLFVQTKTSTT